MDIWTECRNHVSPQHIQHELIRVVESQEQVATNHLVDNLEEQDLLEQMLEDTKPEIPASGRHLHYLLATPFRYPPLEYGSRFGTRFERGIFYGSHTLTTAFAETGYYRFLFWRGMDAQPPSGKLVTQHTAFGARYETDHGLKLQNDPFNDYEEYLSNPADYSATQKLGLAMRDFGIAAFEFKSARDPGGGINAGLFSPAALKSSRPVYQQQWLCEINTKAVSLYSATDGSIHKYPLDTYLVDGTFPEPGLKR